MQLRGKTALVTGAARIGGIGHAFAKGLALAGADIVMADVLSSAESAKIVRDLSGRKVVAKITDLGDFTAICALRDSVNAEFDGCDIIVHCAAILPRSTDLAEIDATDWRRMMAVNLDAFFHLTQGFLPEMKRRRWGRIIGVSSTTFYAGLPGLAHYVASKAGIIGFVRSVAREVGDFGITVNALAPGLVYTDSTAETSGASLEDPQGPWATIRMQQCIRQTLRPEDLVGPLLFLATDASAFVTGQTLLVDGGWHHV